MRNKSLNYACTLTVWSIGLEKLKKNWRLKLYRNRNCRTNGRLEGSQMCLLLHTYYTASLNHIQTTIKKHFIDGSQFCIYKEAKNLVVVQMYRIKITS